MKPTRREVLKAGAIAAGSIALGGAAGAFSRGLQKRPVIGSGEHTYEVYHDWLQPPANLKWGDTHGLVQDSNGWIYVAHTVNRASVSKDAVVVFDEKGKFVKSFGEKFAGGAHGLDTRIEGAYEYLYHCDISRRLIVKTDLNGYVIWEIGMPKEPEVYENEGQWRPTNVAFAPNGDFFVGDGYGSSYVHRYDKDGEYLSLVCGPGSDAGKVSCPHGLWVDERGDEPMLVVADRSNRRLQYFTLDGKHDRFVTEGMRLPCHIHFNKDLMLVPDLSSIVTILGADNQVVAALGDGHPTNLRGKLREEFIPGKFIHPHAAIWVTGDDILVAEWVPNGRITLLKKR